MGRDQEWKTTPTGNKDQGTHDALWQVLDEWQAPQPGASFDENVMARIRAEASPAEDGQEHQAWWQPLVALFVSGKGWAVSAALATVLVAAVLLQTPSETPQGSEQGTGTELSAQQVETALEDLRMLDELYGTTSQEDSQSNRL